jgi:hypothetical protein
MARALGADVRAIAEGIRNDNRRPERYAAGVGSDYTQACPCCDGTERKVVSVYGPMMMVKCACEHREVVERPRALRGIAL